MLIMCGYKFIFLGMGKEGLQYFKNIILVYSGKKNGVWDILDFVLWKS